MLDTTRDVVRKSLLAMLGAITLADDELEQLLDRLAARGEQVARERFNHIETLRNRLTRNEGAGGAGLHEGMLLRQTVQEEIERQGRLLAAALDLPTRDSINLLRAQIEQISTALNQIAIQRAPVIAATDNGQVPTISPTAAVTQPNEVSAPAPTAAVTQPNEVSTPAQIAPIPGYDALNAKQAAAIVAELEEDDLLALREYEQAHRNRITVLRAIEAALARYRDKP